MLKASNTLLSIGAAVASSKLASAISDLEFNDVLRPLGLSRRRMYWPQNLAYLGAGIVVGGVTALLLAPASGRVSRQRLAKKAEELGAATSRKVSEMGDEIREEIREEVQGRRGNGNVTQP
jgi:hypothetical protein